VKAACQETILAFGDNSKTNNWQGREEAKATGKESEKAKTVREKKRKSPPPPSRKHGKNSPMQKIHSIAKRRHRAPATGKKGGSTRPPSRQKILHTNTNKKKGKPKGEFLVATEQPVGYTKTRINDARRSIKAFSYARKEKQNGGRLKELRSNANSRVKKIKEGGDRKSEKKTGPGPVRSKTTVPYKQLKLSR